MTISEIRTKIVGSWRCVQGVTRNADGRPILTFTGGWLTYLADGTMHVIVVCDEERSDPDALAKIGKVLAYGGRWALDDDGRIVTHRISVSTFDDWVGRDVYRWPRFDDEGETLWLEVTSGLGVSLDSVASERGAGSVEWRRLAGDAIDGP